MKIELFKTRNFSELFNDSFAFIKLHGKHFYGNYLAVAGIPLGIWLIFYYYLFSYQWALNTLESPDAPETVINYLSEHPDIGYPAVIIFLLVAIAFFLINISYPTVYFLLYLKHGGESFTYKDIFRAMTGEYGGKILLFVLAWILVLILLLIPFAGLFFISLITLVGWIFLVGFLILWFYLSLFEYLNSKKNVFESIFYAFRLIRKRFFAYTGASGLLIILIWFIEIGISIVLGLFIGLMKANLVDGGSMDIRHGNLMTALNLLNIVINVLLGLIPVILAAFVYFSAKEEVENLTVQEAIENLGQDD